MGSCGSQTTFNSVRRPRRDRRGARPALDAAAEHLEAAREDLELSAGAVRVKGSPEKAVTIADLAADGTFHGKGGRRARGAAGPARGASGGSATSPPCAAADRPRRARQGRPRDGRRPRCVAAVHDCGRILNRVGADGQVYGGVVMGIGQALSEGTQLDELGRQRNPHLLDYKLVTASDAPPIEIDWIETETPNAGPKGSKGVGEPPCVPTAGAIANAIARSSARECGSCR